jgi:hypothetical protein
MKTLDELREAVDTDPAAPEAVELISRLMELPDKRQEVREVCFRALSRDPKNTRVRLTLARSFYLDSMPEFCVRELLQLERYVTSEALTKLLDAFGEFVQDFSQGSTEPKPNEPFEELPDENVMGDIDIDADFEDLEDDLK